MPVQTTRRFALVSALALATSHRRASSALQSFGESDPKSALSWIPPLPDDRDDWPVSILTYADIKGYWDARGVEQPRSFDDETSQLWLEVSQRIPLNDGILFLYMNEDWEELIGFNPWDIDQVAVAFDPPDQVRIYTGVFDPDRIARALASADYEQTSEGEFAVLDSTSDELDLSSDLGRITLGHLSHLAASESMVIASRSRELLDAALALRGGDEESLADRPELAELQTLLPDLHGFVIASLERLDSGGEGDAGSDATASPYMLQLAGFTADQREDTVSLVAEFANEDTANAAVSVVADRIENDPVPSAQIPYSELLGEPVIEVVPGTSLLRLVISEDQFGMRWMRFLYSGDFDYLLSDSD